MASPSSPATSFARFCLGFNRLPAQAGDVCASALDAPSRLKHGSIPYASRKRGQYRQDDHGILAGREPRAGCQSAPIKSRVTRIFLVSMSRTFTIG